MKTGAITGTAGTDVAVTRDIVYYALPQTFAAGSEATATVTIGTKTYSGKITAGNITADKLTTVTIKVNVELPPPPAKIGDYYYSNGTYSTELDIPKDASVIGVVYRTEGTTGMIVSLNIVKDKPWSPTNTTLGIRDDNSGEINTMQALSKGIANFPGIEECHNRGNSWYLPAFNETKALYAGLSGKRWVLSGANTSIGEIDDWNNSYGFGPGYEAAARSRFNAKLTAVGGDPQGTSTLMTSTDVTQNTFGTVNTNTGGPSPCIDNPNGSPKHGTCWLRCVRAF